MGFFRYGIRLRQPATNWIDALPSGNGTVGAMVFGNIARELVLLNHEDLWLRTPKRDLPDVSAHLPELIALLAEGRYQEGAKFLYSKMREKGYEAQPIDPYHPAFDLGLDMVTRAPFSFYRRWLDFTTGEVSVNWTEDDSKFERKLFVSRADDVVVLSIETDLPRGISCTMKLFPHAYGGQGGMLSPEEVRLPEVPISFRRWAEDGQLFVNGRYDNGGEFGGLARITTSGGSITTDDGQVSVRDADEVLVVLKLFANEESEAALARLREELGALETDYSILFERHEPLHRELFERVKLDLNGGEKRLCTAEELLMEAYDGNVENALYEKMFDYGRYLLISSSRPGGLPANLQGVWNASYAPAWECDYHNDWNIEMTYWPALPGNLPEVTLPYFDFYERFLQDYRANAQNLYGCRGILASLAQSSHGLMYAGKPDGRWVGVWLAWTAGAGWLAQLFYDYWLHTGDRDFLRDRAVPFLKEIALFYEDFIKEDENGRWAFSPSHSPENIPSNPNGARVQINATMDTAIAKEVLTNLCTACETLGIEQENIGTWRKLLEKAPDYEISNEGCLREWYACELQENHNHMHMAHVYPLFPGLEVLPETHQDLCRAIEVSVDKRFEHGINVFSCESFAHAASTYARLNKGNKALNSLQLLINSCVRPSLLTCVNDWRGQGLSFFDAGVGYDGWCPPFQIDGNTGFAAAVLEMLVYSGPGIIKLLPALPEKWEQGEIRGVLCRGQVELSLQWNMAQRQLTASFLSQSDRKVTVRFPQVPQSFECHLIQVLESQLGPQYKELTLPAGKQICVRVRFSE